MGRELVGISWDNTIQALLDSEEPSIQWKVRVKL